MGLGQNCKVEMRGRIAGQICRADLHGRFARQICTADLHGRFARQICAADLHGRYAVGSNGADWKGGIIGGESQGILKPFFAKMLIHLNASLEVLAGMWPSNSKKGKINI